MPAKKRAKSKGRRPRAPRRRSAAEGRRDGFVGALTAALNEVLDELDRLADAIVEAIGRDEKDGRPRRR
jgi:hypothetical protein